MHEYNKFQKLHSLKKASRRHGLQHTTKTAKIKKVLLLLQHIATMSTCS